MADAGYAGHADYEAWDAVLAAANPRTPARAVHAAGPELLPQLHGVAMELRDRLRYSEIRTQQLKAELRDERSESLHKLQMLEHEVLHLRDAMAAEAGKLSGQEEHAMSLQRELLETQSHASTANRQLEAALARTAAAEASRDAALQEVSSLRAQLSDAHSRAHGLEARANESAGVLMSTKSQLAELHQLQALYQSAKEELERQDTENHELKDMLSANSTELAASRILDTLPASQHHQQKSMPLYKSPEAMGKRRSKGQKRAVGTGRTALYNASGVMYPPDVAASVDAMSRTRLGTSGGGAGGTGSLATAANLASLAFLGPPSSAYPADPDKFVFVRVAGGYAPKYVGNEPLPKASGWVPKDVVRLAQAFRTTNRIKLEWKHWEPLLLMVDEIYTHGGRKRIPADRGRAEVQDLPNQFAGSVATSPSVMQANVIMSLKKQLAAQVQQATASSKPRGGRGPTEDDVLWRNMAEKSYHMTNAVGEAVGENNQLRNTMAYMDELYSPGRGPDE